MTQCLCLLTVGLLGCSAEIAPGTDPGRSLEPLYVDRGKLIPEPFIPVCWENPAMPIFAAGDPPQASPTDPALRQLVREAVEDTWNRYTRLVFTGWGACMTPMDPGIHIIVENGRRSDHMLPRAMQNTMLDSFGWPRVDGFGLDANNTQRVFLTFDFFEKRTQFTGMFDRTGALLLDQFSSIAVHEFGHLLGFRHEQERTGADTACARQLSLMGDYNPIGGMDPMLTEAGPFDQNSVMSYCAATYNNGGKLSNNDVFYTVRTYKKKASGSLVSFDGKCLDVVPRDGTTAIGQTYDCLGGTHFSPGETASDAQRWYFVPSTSTIVHAFSGAVLDIPNNTPTDGSQVQIFDDVAAPGQRWSIPEAQLRGAGGMCARPVNPTSPMNSEIELDTCDPLAPSAIDLFAVQPDGTLRHNSSGLCIQLLGPGMSRVELRTCDASPAQQWRLDDNGTITNFWGESRVCLDVGVKDDLNRDFEGLDGVNRLQAYSCGQTQNQVFSIAGPVIGMGGKCLNVRGAGRNNGTPVDITTCTGAVEQIWELHW